LPLFFAPEQADFLSEYKKSLKFLCNAIKFCFFL
jgi:hypothetical protein